MRLETFFEKFELFADAPNAVGKMRELILELAIQGKLVDQNPSEGDGHVLLNQIHEKNPSSISDAVEESVDTPLQNIPGSWAPAKLGEVAEIIRGVTFPGSAKSKIRSDNDVACLRTASVQAEIDWDDLIFISPSHVSRFDQWVMPNDIMISMANSYALVGKVAIVRQVPQRATFGAFLAAIRPVLIEPYFLLYVLRSPRMQAAFRNSSSQTTNIANISLGRMRPLPFPLPPLAEQKRIVAKVDELMALCDRLEVQQQERDTRHATLARASLSRFAEAPTPANLDFLFHQSYPVTPADLRKSIRTLAVQGLLVPRDSQSPDWESRKLKGLTTKIGSGSTPAGGKESYQETGVPLIRSMNVHFGGFVRDGLAFLNEHQAEKLKNVTVQADDVLLNITGASIGRVTTAPRDMEGARVNQHVCIVRATPEILPRFLEMFLASPVVQNLIDDVQVGATREALTKVMIEQFEIPLPPLVEQRRIVAKVDQLMALADRLEAQLSVARTKAAALLDAAIHELLNPTAEIVDLNSYRAAVGCYIVKRLHTVPTFGRTAAMKLMYLAEAHVGVPMKLQPRRHFAGPYDEWIERFDEQAAEAGWFTVTERALPGGKSKFNYHPGLALAEQTTMAARLLTSEQRSEFDRLLDLFASKTTEDAEIIATLFAAWNDFLIDGHTPRDDEIIEEVRERWHVSKRRFSPDRLRQWLDWLRQNDLVPQGRSPRTAHQTQLLLN